MSKIFFTAKNDKVFKTILGNEENKELLKTFLERILKKQIDELTFLKNELPVNYPGERRKTVDLLIKIKNQYIHIELNNGYYNYLHMRNFCFFTNTYSKKTKSGEKYNLEDKFLHIDFTYRNQITKENKDKKLADEEVCRVYKVMDKEQKEYIENFEIWEYNMDRIMQIWYDKDEKMSEYKHLIMLDCKK